MHPANLFSFCRLGLTFALLAMLSHGVQAGHVVAIDFSGGSLGPEWAPPPHSTHTNGVVRIAERGGRSHVLSMNLKGNSVGISTVNFSTLQVNVNGFEQVKLSFDHHADHDPVTPFSSGGFQGFPEATGVAVSSNGIDWVPLWSPDLGHEHGWVSIDNLDVSALIAANPQSLSSTGLLNIRFQHFMKVASGQLRSDGRGWDQISVSMTPIPEPSTGLLVALGVASAIGLRIRRR